MLIEKVDTKDKDIVFVYTTCSGREEARHLGLCAIEERIAICADFWAVESVYPWQGVMQDVDQYMVVITTQKVFADDLINFIRGLHSYSIPMISEVDTKFTNKTYLEWADKVLHNSEDLLSEEEGYIKSKNDKYDGYTPGVLK